MRRFFMGLLLLTFLPALVVARVPVFVDIESANREISLMEEENEEASRLTSELISNNESLEQDNQVQQDKIAQARGLISDLGVSRGELYAARNRAVDLDQKGRVAGQLEKNMAQDYQLQGMIEQFNRKISDNDVLITANEKQIARNNLTIGENEDEIAYLRECIALTSENEGSLDDIFSRQNENSSAFDSFMSANKQ